MHEFFTISDRLKPKRLLKLRIDNGPKLISLTLVL